MKSNTWFASLSVSDKLVAHQHMLLNAFWVYFCALRWPLKVKPTCVRWDLKHQAGINVCSFKTKVSLTFGLIRCRFKTHITLTIPLFARLRLWGRGKCQMAGAPTRGAGSIHRCDKTPRADAEITPHSVGASTTLTNPWDDTAFINIYQKRKGNGIISRALILH